MEIQLDAERRREGLDLQLRRPLARARQVAEHARADEAHDEAEHQAHRESDGVGGQSVDQGRADAANAGKTD